MARRRDSQRNALRRPVVSLIPPSAEHVVDIHGYDAVSSDSTESSDPEKERDSKFMTTYYSAT